MNVASLTALGLTIAVGAAAFLVAGFLGSVSPTVGASDGAALTWKGDQWGVPVATGVVTDSLTGCQYIVVINSSVAIARREGVPCDESVEMPR